MVLVWAQLPLTFLADLDTAGWEHTSSVHTYRWRGGWVARPFPGSGWTGNLRYGAGPTHTGETFMVVGLGFGNVGRGQNT